MASLSSAKTLGGIGSILTLFPAVSIVGWILILLSLKEVSDLSQDKTIFKNAIIGTLTAIVCSIVFLILLLDGAAFAFILALIGLTADFGPGGFVGAFATFGVFYASAIISGIFLKQAYDKSTQKLKVGQFATSGLLYLVSAITSILVVGFLIFLIAFIYQIIAFFSIRVPPQITYYGYPPPQPIPYPSPQPSQTQVAPSSPIPQQVTPMPPPPAPTTSPPPEATTAPPQPVVPSQPMVAQFKFCFMCGTRLPVHARFCSNCGTRQ